MSISSTGIAAPASFKQSASDLNTAFQQLMTDLGASGGDADGGIWVQCCKVAHVACRASEVSVGVQ